MTKSWLDVVRIDGIFDSTKCSLQFMPCIVLWLSYIIWTNSTKLRRHKYG